MQTVKNWLRSPVEKPSLVDAGRAQAQRRFLSASCLSLVLQLKGQ